MNIAGDVDTVRRSTEPQDLGVKADGDVDVVFTRKEEDGVTFGTELIVMLCGVDFVDLRLDRSRGYRWIEEKDVRTEVRRGKRCGERRTTDEPEKDEKDKR